MKRSTRRLHKKNKNKNKSRQMGGTTRAEWDSFTNASFERIKRREEEKGTNAAKIEELLKYAKESYEEIWNSFQERIKLEELDKKLRDKIRLSLKELDLFRFLPSESQLLMDDEITGKMMLNTSEGANYNLIPVNMSNLYK